MKSLSPNTFLVALMNNKADFLTAQNKGWYRIPTKQAPKNLRDGIVNYISFYHTKIFGQDKYTIRYYAKVNNIEIVSRKELFPDEPYNPKKAHKEYYKINFGTLQELEKPIPSHRGRRILFIPTTFQKVMRATELNHLFNESPLEEILWEKFLEHKISTERQFLLQTDEKNWILDFAIFCKNGQINVECDGNEFHTKYDHVIYDKFRNNEIESVAGWSVLRFPTVRLEEDMEHCIQTIQKRIYLYGGQKMPDGNIVQEFYKSPDNKQLNLF
jgi:very-short-patch-repair endonuclease